MHPKSKILASGDSQGGSFISSTEVPLKALSQSLGTKIEEILRNDRDAIGELALVQADTVFAITKASA